jgi:hypothetical protein
MASWMAARVTKVSRMPARFSKSGHTYLVNPKLLLVFFSFLPQFVWVVGGTFFWFGRNRRLAKHCRYTLARDRGRDPMTCPASPTIPPARKPMIPR